MPTSLPDSRWTDANKAGFSSPDEIHVWKICLFEPKSDALEILSQDERQRSQKFKNETARKTYLCSRLVMRWLFASYLKQPASELTFQATQQGKPFLAGHATSLNATLSSKKRLTISPIT